tara:strand:- start:170 stop:2236 length:2067 start_codon:yes stop_codon:yes gene_type:complete
MIIEKKEIWISDLTHTQQGNSSWTFPLGASFVYAFTKKTFGDEFKYRLFKFPKDLSEALSKKSPAMLCFSNYSWNFELGYKFANLAKQRDPKLTTVFGGPNFPTDLGEKIEFLQKRSAIDFVIELEGELAFVDLVKNLIDNNFNSSLIKKANKKILNTCYLHENTLVSGPVERIKNINIITSPYLTGALDGFFNYPLIPMLETTRGCPFACTFCADGLATKNGVYRYDSERTREELNYIAKRVNNIDELIITDLNFAMYKQDIETAKMIAATQKVYNFPTLVGAAYGKNLPKRTIEVTKILKGSSFGAAIQSTDPEVLKNIRRSNISTEAYRDLLTFGDTSVESRNKTEAAIILALPGDTKEKHYESIKFAVDNNVTFVRMFQAMLLSGTEMASPQDRKKFGLKTKFRVIPGALGNYDILDKEHPIAEIEEIIVGNNTMSHDDYIDCRIMNLFVTTFYNTSMFEEVFVMLRAMKISRHECLVYLKEHKELYSEKINKILENFIKGTTQDLYDTWEEADNHVLSPEVISKYIGEDMGTNELLENRASLFNEFDDICTLLINSVKGYLEEKNILTKKISDYLIDLRKFLLMRKKDPFKNLDSVKSASFNYDFEAIRKSGYNIDPNTLTKFSKPLDYEFFHNQKQKKHITNQINMYSQSAIGFAKMLQQSNLQLLFRTFSKADGTQISNRN